MSNNTKLDFSFIEIPAEVREDLASSAADASNDQKRWEFGDKFVSLIDWLEQFWKDNEQDIAAELEQVLGRKLSAADRRGFIAQKRAELVSITGYSRSWCAHLESMARFYSNGKEDYRLDFGWYRLLAAKCAGDKFADVLAWANEQANKEERKNCLPTPDEMRHKAMLLTGRKKELPIEIERATRSRNSLRLMLEDKTRNLYPRKLADMVAELEHALDKFVVNE